MMLVEAGMKRASLIVVISVLVSLSFIGLRFLPDARAITLFVGGAGPGNHTTIQAAIDNASAGDTVFVFSGTYQENIIIAKPLSLVGENRNSTLIEGSGFTGLVNIYSDLVNVTGFTLGSGQEPIVDTIGLYLWDVGDCRIANNTFSNNSLAIYLNDVRHTTIEQSTFSSNVHGISLYYSHSILVAGNDLSSGHGQGIWASHSTDLVITDNTMARAGVTVHGDMLDHWNTHAIDTSNTVKNRPVIYWKDAAGGVVPPDAGQVILANSSDIVIENQSLSNVSEGIQLGFSSDNLLANNTISHSGYGISLYSSNSSRLMNNNVLSNARGIYLVHSVGNIMSANRAIGNYVGIQLQYSDANRIENNTASSNLQKGISAYWSTNNTIAGNVLLHNRDGIILQTYSDHNIVRGNTASESMHRGIYLFTSRENTIENNTMVSNGFYGVSLVMSDLNRVYHNNFIDNSQQANDETDTNIWDDGYPSGGNYWSDYSGIDDCSGPNQDNCPDPDGIGDTPYTIDNDSQDRYPLAFPSVVIPHRPPTVLDAVLSGPRLENVTLMWNLSPDDGRGLRSVVGYEIHRGETYNANGFGYAPVAILPNETSIFVDADMGEGDPGNYFYRVCALNATDGSICASDQAAKFTRPQAPGPNLVSIPLIQSNESIETVLQTVAYDRAWFYDSSSGEWKWYMRNKEYRRGLWKMSHSLGMWVNVTEDSNLTVAGVVPTQTTIHLYEGWNLLSFPSFNSSYAVYDLRMDTGALRVEGYDPTPPYHLRVLGDADVLQAGYGYWVRVEANMDWIVEVS